MNIDDAKGELDSAERDLRGCENEVHRTSGEWLKAEAARGDNRMHSRLRGQYGENYLQRLKDDWEGARKAFSRAVERRDTAKAAYERALAERDAK
ncbi:MAG: hypothetical protein OXE87_04755 [Chloroflexi bacterium]|nr:hypothetical protein [Chloroflexota bacterium]